MTPEDAATAYVAFYERLTPESIGELHALCTPEVRFRDPFNDVVGIAAYEAVLAKMFRDVSEPRFRVTDRAFSDRVCYLRWRFRYAPDGSIEGMSEVHFDLFGKVTAHIDHWDSGSQFYATLPILGALIRLVKRRLAAR